MILVIIAAWLAYKKAKLAQRNPWLWAFITSVAFIGTQTIVAIGLSILVEITASNGIGNASLLITVISLIASFIVMWRILKFLDGVPENETFLPPPPPPTNFN